MEGSGTGNFELVESYDGDAFRAIYSVRFEEAIYVLHAFQKKSRKGIATLKEDIGLARSRLKTAEELHAAWVSDTRGSD